MSNISIYKKYHYTYWITNTKENKHYLGVRSCDIPPIYDLGVRYFSSSTNKEFIKHQEDYSTQYHYRVIGLFPTRELAMLNEIELHSFYNVKNNSRFYNKTNQTSTGFDASGIRGIGKLIQQYSKDGVLIKEDSINIFVNEGFCRKRISACCLGKDKTHHEFIWKYKDDVDFNFPNFNVGKIIQQYSKDGSLIKEATINIFKKEGKIDHISCCCLGLRKTYRGFIWKYKYDENFIFPNLDHGLLGKEKSEIHKIHCRTVMLGKKHSPETIEKRRKSLIGKGKMIQQYDMCDNYIKENTVNVFSAEGFSRKSISRCCLRKRNSHKGFKWKYNDQESS